MLNNWRWGSEKETKNRRGEPHSHRGGPESYGVRSDDMEVFPGVETGGTVRTQPLLNGQKQQGGAKCPNKR